MKLNNFAYWQDQGSKQ